MSKHIEVQLFPFVKLSLLLFFIWLLGFVYGIGLFVIMLISYEKFMTKYFGLIAMTSNDQLFMFPTSTQYYLAIGFTEIKEKNYKDFLETFIERGLKKFEKLRSIRVVKHFEFWWKPLSISEALNRVEINYDNETIINTEEQKCEYSTRILKQRFDLDKQMPYSLTVLTHPDSKPMVIWKVDHALSDAMGFISYIIATSDNYNLDLFPFKNRDVSFFTKALMYLQMVILLPYYACKSYYMNIYRFYMQGHSPLQFQSERSESRNSTFFALSKPRDFNQFAKMNKALKVTFNDLIVSVISASVKKLFIKRNCLKRTEFTLALPITMRSFPKKLEDLQIHNNTCGMCAEVPLVDEPLSECRGISKMFASLFRNFPYVLAIEWILRTLHILLPNVFVKNMLKFTLDRTDLVISNIPGPKEALIYNGIECVDFMTLGTSGMHSSFIIIMSYKGKFKYSVWINENVGIDPKELLDIIDLELDLTIEKWKKMNLE